MALVCLSSAIAQAQPPPSTPPPPSGSATGDAQGGVTVTNTAKDTPPPDANAANATAAANAHASVTARIPVDAGVSLEPSVPFPLEYGLDFGVATMRSDRPAQGYGPMFAVIFNAFANDWVGFGLRGQLVYSPDPAVDGPMREGYVDDVDADPFTAWSFTAGPRLRLWSDPAARLRWLVDLDGGVVMFEEGGGASPLARVTLGRMVGGFDSRGNGVNGGVALSAEAGFGDAADYQAVFGSTWFHGEGGVDAAANPGPHDGWFPSTFTLDFPVMLGKNFGSVYGGLPIGVSAAFGVAVSELVEPRIRLDTLGMKHHEGDATKMIGGSAGVRLRFDRWVRAFVDLYGGYEHAFGVEPLRIGSGPFIDIGSGFHSVQCRWAADFGVRLRLGVGDANDKLATLVLVLGGGRANAQGALGKPIHACKPGE